MRKKQFFNGPVSSHGVRGWQVTLTLDHKCVEATLPQHLPTKFPKHGSPLHSRKEQLQNVDNTSLRRSHFVERPDYV